MTIVKKIDVFPPLDSVIIRQDGDEFTAETHNAVMGSSRVTRHATLWDAKVEAEKKIARMEEVHNKFYHLFKPHGKDFAAMGLEGLMEAMEKKFGKSLADIAKEAK